MFSSKPRVLVDSGPIIALYNDTDQFHQECKIFFGDTLYQFETTEAVATEVFYKIQKNERNKARAYLACLSVFEDFTGVTYLVNFFDLNKLKRMKEIRTHFKEISALDYADLSLVVLAEHHEIGKIVTLDNRDFSRLTWKSKLGMQNFEIIDPRH